MDMGLKGKVALVAAASRGMGKGIAEAFAREGAKAAICSRKEDAILQAGNAIRSATKGEILSMVADLKKYEDIRSFVTASIEAFGGIDILVTNAGGPPPGDFEKHDDQTWDEAFRLTLLSVVRLIREVIPHMKKRGGGRIINMTSMSVKEPIPGLLLSNSLRPGVIGLAKTLSRELAQYNILINNIAPGRIDTERIRELDKFRAEAEGCTPEEIRKRSQAAIPLGRYGRVEEIANAVLFLASEKASYITGVTLPVDGGAIQAIL